MERNELVSKCIVLCQKVYYESVKINDLAYSITTIDGITIVAIRGSVNKANWLTNIRVMPWKSDKGFFSTKGFTKSYRELAPFILKELPKNSKVVFTGHSLGGAIATLFAERLGCEVITFGSPRIYFRSFYKSNINHIRVVQDNDPVPRVPMLLYTHKCEPLRIKDNDNGINIKDHYISDYAQAWEDELRSSEV